MRDRYIVEERGFETPCWTWQLSKNNRGYARVRVGGREWLAHRYYHEQKHGPVPDGFVLDHLCRNSDCVNPDHTEVVTQAVNVQRGNKAVLTRAVVAEIRAHRIATGASYRMIGRLFGVDHGSVGRIVRGEMWA